MYSIVRKIELCEVVMVDIIEGETRFIEGTLHQFRPVFGVEGLWELFDELHFGHAKL